MIASPRPARNVRSGSARGREYLVYPGKRTLRVAGEKMAAGGEADVYQCGQNAVAKIPREPTDKWGAKSEWGVANRRKFYSPSGDYAAWPQKLLVDPASRKIVGVALPFLKEHAPLSALLDPAKRDRVFPHWDGETLVGVAKNVLIAFDWLHQRGVIHGDGSAPNVMVNRRGRVTLIDCDNSQYDTGRQVLTCGVTTGDYCPPELQPKTEEELVQFVRSASQDTFSAAVIALQLMSGSGIHPYSGRWDKSDGSRPPATERRIEINAWSGAKVGPGAGKVTNPKKSIPIEAFGPEIANLTRQTFDGGWEDASNRPSLQAWITALGRLQRALRPCVRNHRHTQHRLAPRCSYCDVLQTTGVDLMPRRPRKGLKGKPGSGWASPPPQPS